jgi:hypothetical protein
MPYFFARFSAVTGMGILPHFQTCSLTAHGGLRASRVLVDQCGSERVLQFEINAVSVAPPAVSLRLEQVFKPHLEAPLRVYGLMLIASAPPVRQTCASPSEMC